MSDVLEVEAKMVERRTLVSILEVIFAALLAINIATTGWLCTTVIRNGDRLTHIEANRFTTENGLELWKQIAMLQQQITENRMAISTSAPPEWFLKRFELFEAKLDDLALQVAKLNK